jgi:hypothetical protein
MASLCYGTGSDKQAVASSLEVLEHIKGWEISPMKKQRPSVLAKILITKKSGAFGASSTEVKND